MWDDGHDSVPSQSTNTPMRSRASGPVMPSRSGPRRRGGLSKRPECSETVTISGGTNAMRDIRGPAQRIAAAVGALALSSILLATAAQAWASSTTTTKPSRSRSPRQRYPPRKPAPPPGRRRASERGREHVQRCVQDVDLELDQRRGGSRDQAPHCRLSGTGHEAARRPLAIYGCDRYPVPHTGRRNPDRRPPGSASGYRTQLVSVLNDSGTGRGQRQHGCSVRAP